jgi:DNA-binding CsgD family transcriptional regulator/tetratricopeptide (TPR) repeat protein
VAFVNSLVGRAPSLSLITGHLDATARGRGNCLIIDGPFGIGKTDLLKAAGAEGAERGLTVVAGRAGTTDQPTPIHLLITYLRHAAADQLDLSELSRPDANPFWLMDRVGELVESAARRHPVVVALDDAQRIDDINALALRGLVRSLASAPVLWLLARRSVPTAPLAQQAVDWLTDHAAARLRLEALDDESVAELCRTILGARPDASVLRWAARCGGNPWLVKNVFSALLKAGQMIIVGGMASVTAEDLPSGVRAVVGGALDELSPAARRLLVTGRRIGPAFTVDEVVALLDHPQLDVAASVEEAVSVGLIRRQGPELSFVHEVIGDVLRHPDARDGEPVRPIPVVVPLPSAPPAPGPAVDRDDHAITTPATGHPDTESPAPSSECACEELTSRALTSLADTDDAPEALAAALRLLAGAGRPGEARRLADVARRRGMEAATEAQLVLELGQGLRDADRPDLVAELLQRTLTRPDVCELDRARLVQLLAEVARRTGGRTGPVTSLRPVAGPHRCEPEQRPLWTWLVRALVAADRFEQAAAALTGIRPAPETPGLLWHGHRAELLLAVGRFDAARREAENALRLAGPAPAEDAVPACLVLARISLLAGDLATAGRHLRAGERLLTGRGTADRSRLEETLVLFHAAGGRAAMTVQSVVGVDGRVTADRLLFAEAPNAAATVIRHAREAGLGAEAERAAELARRIARRNPVVQSLAAGAEHAQGLLRNDAISLRRAAELFRTSGRPLAAANALEDAARVEEGGRDKAQAVRLLESAAELYLDGDARYDLDRVEKKLRRLRAQNVRRLTVERPSSGWASLTTAELRVVRAIVGGRTNREAASALFLSPHTVDTHLRRVFSKLDINSRVELTRRFIAHESSPAGAGARVPDYRVTAS